VPSSIWTAIEATLAAQLDGDDDQALWEAVLQEVFKDAEALAQCETSNERILAEVGRCSHWLRPHQTRWVDGGGFAWPVGYGGIGYSRSGMPQFDWATFAYWSPVDKKWLPRATRPTRSSRMITFRVAIPSRSLQHEQAAVHTVWRPGPPQHPRKELVQFYGFRRADDGWKQTAYRAFPDEMAYDDLETSSNRVTKRLDPP